MPRLAWDGSRLPGEHKLAEQFDVSRITIRRALEAGLVHDDLHAGNVLVDEAVADAETVSNYRELVWQEWSAGVAGSPQS